MARLTELSVVRIAVVLAGGLILPKASIAADSPKDAKNATPQAATEDSAVKELRRLGAVVETVKSGKGGSENVTIRLRHEWIGKSDDFKLLRRVPNLEFLAIIGVPMTDDDLKLLDDLK